MCGGVLPACTSVMDKIHSWRPWNQKRAVHLLKLELQKTVQRVEAESSVKAAIDLKD